MNINDVAREAGLSKTTVSRVLLNSNKVKPATKEKVLAVIKRMNYTPNTSAQMLAKKRNSVIGVISGMSICDPFYGYMGDCIAKECQQYGYGALYAVCQDSKMGYDKEISMLYGKVDAYVLLGAYDIGEESIDKLTSMGMPVAIFKPGLSLEGAITVDIDNVKSGELAAQYLYKKGYRKLGYLHGSMKNDFSEGLERYRGFMKKAEALGLKLEKDFYGDRSYKAAFALADKIIGSGVDALFCETDIMAYAVVDALKEKGVKIPGDIAILGFDDIKFKNYESNTHLSTIAQPMERMAACIVAALVNRIEHDVPYGKEQLFETAIVEGKTT